MNLFHRRLCASAKWSRKMQHRVADRVDGFDLGAHPLEIGPGFGATTRALLRGHAHALTALEIDPDSARRLHEQFGDRARIVRGDGVEVPRVGPPRSRPGQRFYARSARKRSTLYGPHWVIVK